MWVYINVLLYSLKSQAELWICPSFQEHGQLARRPSRGGAEDTAGKFIGGVDEHQLKGQSPLEW